MRTLYFKLILIFLAVSLAGTLLAAFLIRRSNERAFERLLREQARAYFVRDVQAYYVATGSWEGVRYMLYAKFSRGPHRAQPQPYALANVDGTVIAPAGPWEMGETVPDGVLSDGVPVTVDGHEVGTVLLLDQEPPRNALEEHYLAGVNRALLLGALGATAIAVVLGAVFARTLTQPLREVADASRAMAGGELGRQVPVRTHDELGQLATAFNQMSNELARMTRQRRQLTADIAHDLRTPLTVLAGYLEAMEEETLAPTPERLATMRQEVSGLTRLVEDLRILSLAEAGTLPLRREPTDVGELLSQVRQAHAPQAKKEGVDLHVDVPAELPQTHLDPERMRQVLGNLISNALRHTAVGGSITLAAGQNGSDGVVLRVRDTGTGIAPDDLPHIFDRFYRGDESRQEGQGESGLGLAIARSIVEMHGGTIAVESAAGQGTTFRIRLPAG